MATQPILTIQFNVETDWPKYTTKTSNLRDMLKDDDATAPDCFGLPVLPIEVHDLRASRNSWLAIVLETNKTHKKAEAGKEEVKKKITLRLRSQNLYLDAYQNVDGKWFEYKSAGGRLYQDPESQELSECDGSYAQLGQGIENSPPDQPQPKPAEARKRIPVGKKELIEAVNQLADLTDGSTVDARKYQIVVIGMICESLRFEKITQLLTSGVTHTTLPDWMYSIVVNWSTLSRALLTAAKGGKFTLRRKDSDAIGIKTQEEAVAATGMVKRPRQVPPRSQVVAEGIQESNSYQQSLFAEAMVEVFELRIQRIDGKSNARVYGTLTVDEVFTHFLFSRGRSNPESVRPGSTPLLTGPPADFISASDPFSINIDLKDADTNREISRGTIEWNVYNLGPGKYYNRLMQEEVRGTYGSATISYAVFSSAVSATIEITLVNGANVFGRVDASNTSIRQGGQSVLFHKEKEQNVNVRPRQLVPLSRSIVALPTNSNLSVRAELWNASSRNDEIANGTASFRPQMEGTSTQRISGRHGAIEVRVTWNKF